MVDGAIAQIEAGERSGLGPGPGLDICNRPSKLQHWAVRPPGPAELLSSLGMRRSLRTWATRVDDVAVPLCGNDAVSSGQKVTGGPPIRADGLEILWN